MTPVSPLSGSYSSGFNSASSRPMTATMPSTAMIGATTVETIKQKLALLKQQLDQKDAELEQLRVDQQALQVAHRDQLQEAKDTSRQQLVQQKSQMEAIIVRHQSFIDQLLEDKKALTERCQKLSEQMSQVRLCLGRVFA